MRTTLADIRNDSRIPAALGICSTDDRLVTYINEAQQRLITAGAWWGLTARYRCTATEGLLVWPRQIATILGVAVCNVPLKIRDDFWEFQQLGFGIQDADHMGEDFLPRDTWPVFSQPLGNNKELKVYCDLLDDVGSPLLVMGYDENLNWIRTLQGGVWADGEVILASTTGTLSTKIYTTITGVQKLETNGPIRVYEYDTTALTQRAIAKYEYDETSPNYRVTYISWLDECAGTGEEQTVEVIAKLDYVPVKRDTDYLLIGCIPALKDMVVAIKASEQEPLMENKAKSIVTGLMMAKQSLEDELRHYRGAPISHLSVTGSAGITAEPIETLV